MESLTCASFLVPAVHMKVRQALFEMICFVEILVDFTPRSDSQIHAEVLLQYLPVQMCVFWLNLALLIFCLISTFF